MKKEDLLTPCLHCGGEMEFCVAEDEIFYYCSQCGEMA